MHLLVAFNILKRLFACSILLTCFALPLSAWAVDSDGDGDGVDDSVDAFPALPEATTDTDGDGKPDVLNKIIFQDSFDGSVAAGWTSSHFLVGSWGWNIQSAKLHSGTGSLYATVLGGMGTKIRLTRSVIIPAAGGTISFWHIRGANPSYYNYFDIDNINTGTSLFQPSTWQKAVFTLTPGTHELIWRAECAPNTPAIFSCGYLDDVQVSVNSSLVEDTDDDNDGVVDATDKFPLNAAESVDTDNDGIGNNTDMDDDNDGVPDYIDAAPLNAANASEIILPVNSNYKGSALQEQQSMQ